jgi:hypothetical protein
MNIELNSTVSPTPSVENPQTHLTPTADVSNAELLAEIFVGLGADERPMVLSIAGLINRSTKWHAGVAWTPASATDNSALNWYFTLSTFRPVDGQYRRKKEQFCRAFGVVLDDVGTKAAARDRLDACPPSYLIETSTGNFQAGYLFDKPCTELARVEALLAALVKAGLSDPGATGPSARLGRLPCGANGKYSPVFQCRLVEWHPARRYPIEQIVELLGLEPIELAGNRRRRKSSVKSERAGGEAQTDVFLPRATENAVVDALRQRGLYKQALGDGKHDLTCPWLDEHTGQLDHGTAYFEPSEFYPVGGFKCQHGHGMDKRLGALLDFLGVTFTEAKHKPTIRVVAGELDRVVDAAERELAADGRHYQRGGLIVTVVTEPGIAEARIKPISPNALMRALSSIATWDRYDKRSEDYLPIDPTEKHVNVLFDSQTYRHLPVLQGITRQPYLRHDGSLMTTSGFDSASGMYGAFDARSFLVPAQPTRDDAMRALTKLQALLVEFSFAKPHDQAAALGLILTASIRPTLSVAPMGHIKAPMFSSGKSYLTDLIAAFAGPSKPSAFAFPSNDEECSKLLLSALSESVAVIVFDNLNTDLIAFKSLCSAMTEEFLTGRILGISKTATVPTRVLFLSSGNNVDPVRDMTRRVVTVSLDPACETPATRKFRGDPVGAVRRDRERFVALALTIVRAYVHAGYPEQDLLPLGSYGEWTRLVRAPLAWLGQPDPATAIYKRMSEDPDAETLDRLLTSWQRVFGTVATSVREVVEKVEIHRSGAGITELAEVIREISEERGAINRRRLGRWIARHADRLVRGRRFTRDNPIGGSERWWVGVKVVPVVSTSAVDQDVMLATDDCEAF